jgi:hypothetical protein
LLAVKSYGQSKREATYQCMCLRCGSLHEILRTTLQAMARSQKRRKQPFGELRGHCPNCKETDPQTVTLRQYLLQKFAANGLQVVHVVVHRDNGTMARIRICDRSGAAATCEVRQPNGESTRFKVEMDETGSGRWLICAEQMFEMLISNLEARGIRAIAYHDGFEQETLLLRP